MKSYRIITIVTATIENVCMPVFENKIKAKLQCLFNMLKRQHFSAFFSHFEKVNQIAFELNLFENYGQGER